VTLDVWSNGVGMAASRPAVSARLDAGAELRFSLKDFYPGMAAGDLYALQLRAYMPIPGAHVRVLHERGQATVHVAHTLLSTSGPDAGDIGGAVATGGDSSAITKGSTLVPLGLDESELYHLHIAITCALHSRVLAQCAGMPRCACLSRVLYAACSCTRRWHVWWPEA
jgi:hypothetical protein